MSSSKRHDLEEVARERFSYLTEEYGLTYRQSGECSLEFYSSKIRILLSAGRKSPEIYIYKTGEPDFTGLVFPRIIQYLESRVDIDELFRFFPDHPLGDNIRFSAKLFENYAQRIVYHIDEWWVPAQVFQYRLLEKDFKEAGQIDDFINGFKDDHDYLKRKGAI